QSGTAIDVHTTKPRRTAAGEGGWTSKNPHQNRWETASSHCHAALLVCKIMQMIMVINNILCELGLVPASQFRTGWKHLDVCFCPCRRVDCGGQVRLHSRFHDADAAGA